MPDQNVREIQLGGKQLVFLFMTSVVLAVAIFLLGISVGRGVGAPAEEPAPAAQLDADSVPGEMPPETKLKEEDVGFHDALAGRTPPPALQVPPADSAKPTPAPATPGPTDTTSVSVANGARPQAAQPAVAPPPVTETPTAKPAVDSKPSASGWYVQVAAFKSRENADRQVSQLKAKGYSAVVQSDPGSLFRVRIGPFKDNSDARSTAERLRREDGIRATVGR